MSPDRRAKGDYSQEFVVIGVVGFLAYDDGGLLIVQFKDDVFSAFG